mmetsp:Transcript_84510/g.229397  ORF Transcript_84510/g.229397 Transcript_84510/m.229397 type:complete len:462 (+) Transcript_84510:88-1473(+)
MQVALSRQGQGKLALLAGASLLVVRALLRRWRLRRTPPGWLGLPLLGETLTLMADPVKFVEDHKKLYGPIFKTGVLGSKCVYLTGDHAKLILKMPNVGWPAHFLDILGHTAVSSINGPRHKFQRTVCGAAFTDEALERYLPAVERLTSEHLELWAQMSKAGPFDPRDAIKAYTFEIAEKILLGTSIRLGSLMSTFTEMIDGMAVLLPFNLPFLKFGRAMRARKTLLTEYQRIIDEKHASADSNARDMLALVMNEGQRGEPMTNEELLDFSLTIQFAGHDTTKSTIQTLLYYLDAKPAIRKELEEELSAIYDGSAPLTYKQVQACQDGKCGRFISEVMRAIPAVNTLFREVVEDMEIEGYLIPKGWKVAASLSEVQQINDPLDIDMSNDHKSMRVLENCPFGLGNRMCLGYRFGKFELMVWLMCILSKYSVAVTKSQLVPFLFHYVAVQVAITSKASPMPAS